MSIKLAILGMGNMGCNYAQWICDGLVSDVEIKAITRISPERKEKLKKLFDTEVEIFSSVEELFEAVRQQKLEIDAVLIATPHIMHEEQTIKAMRLGLHVLCDKPAGVFSRQARLMTEEALKHKELVFAMMFNQRMNTMYQMVKKMIDSKMYGSVKRVQWVITDWYRPDSYYNDVAWRGTWEKDGGGILLNQCPHNLDILQWLFGMPESVRAFCNEGKYHQIEVEDEVTAYFEFGGGCTGVFYATTGEASGINRLEIAFEDALIVCENETLKVRELKVHEPEYRKTATDHFAQPEGRWKEILYETEEQQHAKMLQNFIDAIAGKDELFVSGAEGNKSLILSNAMYLSSWQKKTMKLPRNKTEEIGLEQLFVEEMHKKVIFFQSENRL